MPQYHPIQSPVEGHMHSSVLPYNTLSSLLHVKSKKGPNLLKATIKSLAINRGVNQKPSKPGSHRSALFSCHTIYQVCGFEEVT